MDILKTMVGCFTSGVDLGSAWSYFTNGNQQCDYYYNDKYPTNIDKYLLDSIPIYNFSIIVYVLCKIWI